MEENITLYRQDGVGVLSGTAASLAKFIVEVARINNYGIYRYWHEDDKYYYDCGPAVFYSLEPLMEEK